MAIRRELLLVIILLLAATVLVKAVDFFSVNVEKGDASKFVLEDIRVKYPNADAGILQTNEMRNSQGEKYFEVKARVTEGLNTPCPRRIHIYYNYPVQNFVPQPAEVITQNCAVCTEGTCILNYPEEAIIASHTFRGTEEVTGYLRSYPEAAPNVEDVGNEWTVSCNYSNASDSYQVILNKDGALMNVTQIVKGEAE